MRYIFILLLFVNSLLAQSFSTRYDVNVSLFGNVGYADVTLTENGDNYEMKLVANTVGTAAVLLSDRVETFTSKGKIKNGKYIPDIFIKTKDTTKKTRHETYYFNHDKKEITFVEKKTKMVSKMAFDSDTFKLKLKDVKESSKNERVLDIYKDSDTLSSYLNAQKNCDTEEKSFKIVAFGAHDEKNNVVVSRLEGNKKKSAKLHFPDDVESIYNLHVEPFNKDDSITDVLVGFDKNGHMKEALMGEIFWVGKITAKRVRHNFTLN